MKERKRERKKERKREREREREREKRNRRHVVSFENANIPFTALFPLCIAHRLGKERARGKGRFVLFS